MKKEVINKKTVCWGIAILLFLSTNAFGRDMDLNKYRDGYGSYDTMGQNPDEIIDYGRDMMRYGFHDTGMKSGSSKYPGYSQNVSDETIKKLNAEQVDFIKATEVHRQTIYEKELYLKSELGKKEPDVTVALGFQDSISEARAKYEQIMIRHLIRMKKINSDANN